MGRPLIAVTDSVFPSLDPAMAALKRIDPELRMAKSASRDDILAVARDADAILVTYAKLPGDLLRELARCRELVLNVPISDLQATHFGINRAVNALWDQTLRSFLHLHREGQRQWQSRSTEPLPKRQAKRNDERTEVRAVHTHRSA